jgi:hypothetical protein
MFFKSKYALIPSALLVLGALAVGCGDDDSEDKTGDNNVDGGKPSIDGSTPSTGDSGGGGGGAAPGPLTDFSGTLVSILAVDTSAPIPTPHVVELLNPEGKPYTPTISGMTAATTGTITLKGPPDPMMFWIKGAGTETYDTVILGVRRNSGDKLLRISSAGTLSLANSSGGFQNKPDRAALTGTVYWTKGGVRMGTIGCVKYFVDGKTTNDTDQDQLYNAASGLPTTIDKQSQTLTGGRWYLANATVGTHKLKFSLDNGATFLGNPSEYTLLVPFPRSAASSATKAVLVQTGIDVEADKNPTPAGCVDPAPVAP